MLAKLKKLLFPTLIAISALSVSASAAFYSVSGLSKLFAGATFAVIIMAASLEIAKLVIASLLYQYRKTLPRILKYYLSTACFILILITSMGIYGFLSSAYQETAAKAGNIDAQVALIEVKRDNIKEQLLVYNEEKTSINASVTSLRNGLSNNVIQYTDTLGRIITTTSSSTRKALEKQLDQAIDRQTVINSKVDDLNEQLFTYETEIVEITTSDAVVSELGPLKYLSGLTGLPMDRIINYLLLTIIFVFDPLAIALVIAANFAFEQILPRTKKNLYGEKVVIEPIEEELPKEEAIEQAFEEGYTEKTPPPPPPPQPKPLFRNDTGEIVPDFEEEKNEIERIIKRPLTQWEIRDLRESSRTDVFGKSPKKDDNDDLIIKYND
jgi:Skp family chaperone for outer membrane proteins